MKIAFAFFVLVIFGLSMVASSPLMSHIFDASSSTNCNSTESCANKKGATCTGDYFTKQANDCSLNNTAGSACCSQGLWCINGTCETDNIGAACTTSGDCRPSFTAQLPTSCVSSVCQYLYLPGDSCSTSADCISSIACNSTSGFCQGNPQGTSCTPYSSASSPTCNFGLYCSPTASVCTPTIASGQTCTLGSVPCYPGLSCISGTCKTSFSVGAGGACSNEMTCSSGYSCASNSTCVSVTTSPVSCVNDTSCFNNGLCKCSPFTGDQFCTGDNYINDPCTDEKSNLASCLAENFCTEPTDAPNSCCYANCLSEYKKQFSCGCSLMNTRFGTCYYNQYCGGFPVWAIIVIIVVAIVLVLAIVLLVFFMMRRRRHYDSI